MVNATFPSFMKLCRGDLGGSVTQPGHTLLAVNCYWTVADDIGQLWERGLKREAAGVLSQGWECIYCVEPLRTSRGKNGTLFRHDTCTIAG